MNEKGTSRLEMPLGQRLSVMRIERDTVHHVESEQPGMGVEKLYESENLFVVNKPYDMYINSDDEKEKNTVTYQIASGDSHLSSSSNPLHFVQRLDYATSGVLCIAKTKYAAARAGKLFEKRETKKYYLAVVRGHVRGFDMGEIKYQVGIDPVTAHTCHKMTALTDSASLEFCKQPRAAHTRMLVLEHGSYGGDPVSVVLLKPITGRRHQLRVHCSAIGHTILGDYTYSNAVDHKPHRMFLHAMRLVLPLPKEHIDIQTTEPFFSDDKFTSKWKSEKAFQKYKTKEDFKKACDLLDSDFVLGLKYKHYVFEIETQLIPTESTSAPPTVSTSPGGSFTPLVQKVPHKSKACPLPRLSLHSQ